MKNKFVVNWGKKNKGIKKGNVLKIVIKNNHKVQTSIAKPKVEFKLNGDIAQSFNDAVELWDMEMEAGITDIETGIL